MAEVAAAAGVATPGELSRRRRRPTPSKADGATREEVREAGGRACAAPSGPRRRPRRARRAGSLA
eukprot:382959-Pleurochrysis_carterae.AAC.1